MQFDEEDQSSGSSDEFLSQFKHFCQDEDEEALFTSEEIGTKVKTLKNDYMIITLFLLVFLSNIFCILIVTTKQVYNGEKKRQMGQKKTGFD